MGYIKKLKNNELVGGTDKTTIYPVTSTKAVFEEVSENNFQSQEYLNNHIYGGEGGRINEESITDYNIAKGTVTKEKLTPQVQTMLDEGQKKALTPKGNYNSETEYEALDLVFDPLPGTNSSYISLQTPNVGHPVDENAEGYEEGWWEKTLDGTAVNTAQAAIDAKVGQLETQVGTAITQAETAVDEAKQETLNAYTQAEALAQQITDWSSSEISSTPSYTDQHPLSNRASSAQIGYFECGTSSATQASNQIKAVTAGGYALPTSGGAVKIKMYAANTYTPTTNNPVKLQFNADATTLKELRYNNEPVSANNSWDAGEVLSVYYDGTYYQASNAQGGSNRKIDAYLYGDLRALAVGQKYDTGTAVKTTDKQFRRLIKDITPLSLSETLTSGALKVSGNATYRAASAISTYNPSTTYADGAYALGSMTIYTLTVSAESVTAGNITVNGTAVAIETTDDAASIASKIAAALVIDGWTTSASENIVTVRCNTIGNNTTTITITDTDSTGVVVASSSIAGTNVIRKYDEGTWVNATVSGMETDGILVSVDKAWLITNATKQNSVTQDVSIINTLYNSKGDFKWLTGNVKSGAIETYANKHTIFSKPISGDADSFIIKWGGISGKTAVLYYFNGSSWVGLGNLPVGEKSFIFTYDTYMITVWDKPTDAQVKNSELSVTFLQYLSHEVKAVKEELLDNEIKDGNKIYLGSTAFTYSGEINTNGTTIKANTKTCYSTFIEIPYSCRVKRIITFAKNVSTTNKFYCRINYYNESKTPISSTGSSFIGLFGNKGIPANAYYFRITIAMDNANNQPQTFFPALISAYQIYFTYFNNYELLYNNIKNVIDTDNTVTNPLTTFDFADPTIWNGEDGYYYAYCTGTIASKELFRSTDLFHWENTGERPFNDDTVAKIASINKGTSFWAACVKKIGDYWNMYFSIAKTGYVVVLRSKYPKGYFKFENDTAYALLTPSTGIVNIDADVTVDKDGNVWMFWGSDDGIYRIQLTEDGLHIKEGATKVHVAGRRYRDDTSLGYTNVYEAASLYQRGNYWYMFASGGQTQYGGNYPYHLVVGRSESIDGVFVDADGNNMTGGKSKTILSQSGSFKNPGHCAYIMPFGVNRTVMFFHAQTTDSVRKLCCAEILWDENGWPYVEGGTVPPNLKIK